jgi:splicing factor 3B subunit 3
LGDDDDEGVESSSSTLMETEEGYQPVFFDPRPLRNLEPLDRLDSLAAVLDMKVANLAGEEIPQIYAACGRGARSSLRVLRPGLAVTEMAVSPLPGNPTAVWTIKRSVGDEFDAFIVVSFSNATLVLRCGGVGGGGGVGVGWGARGKGCCCSCEHINQHWMRMHRAQQRSPGRERGCGQAL